MGPPIDPAAPAVDLYGEGSRKYRRTVYTHNEWVKHRSSDRFVNNISTLVYSGIYKNIGKEVLATSSVAVFVWAWNMLVGGYEDFSGVMHDPLISSKLASAVGLPLTIFTTLSPSLGLLLVFRTNTSYNRWDEARKFWGLNINHTRDLNRMAAAWYGNDSNPGSPLAPKQTAREIDPVEREYLLGQVSLFTWAFVRSMKRHLSPPDEDEEDYIAELKSRLTQEQADAIISAAHRPNRALYDLSVAIEKLPMHFMRKNEINKNLSIFEDTLGGSERLLSSPVPLFYSRHTARFISVWLLFLPFALYGQFSDSWNHITMIPATALISLFLFGIEELATQLEEPFTILPMQGFCDKIGANCNEIVSWAGQDLYETPEKQLESSAVDTASSLDLFEEPDDGVKDDLEVKLPEMELKPDEAEDDITVEDETSSEMISSDLEMESDLVEGSDDEVDNDAEDKPPEMEMKSDEAEDDLNPDEETPVEVESENSELKMDSVRDSAEVDEKDEVLEKQPEMEMESGSGSEPETTEVEETPLEQPELRMEDDWKKTNNLARKSLRELVEGL